MIHTYDEMYVDGAMQRLGDMLEYVVLDLKMEPDSFFKMFTESSFAWKFEIGDVSVIAGRSGPEIAAMVIYETDFSSIDVAPAWREDRSDVFWAGWVLAYYQWYQNLRFSEIWKNISIRKLQKLYPTLHEADILKTVETMNRMMKRRVSCKIADLRKIRGWSQAQLAEMAEMSVSQLQRLEYGERKAENLTLKTALSLSRALGIGVEELH